MTNSSYLSMTKEELRTQVIDKYPNIENIGYSVNDYVDEVIEALAFLESIPDEELLSFIKNDEPTYETMDEIEKTYISKYEEFSEGRYKDYIFNVLDTYDFEQYVATRFNIITSPVEYMEEKGEYNPIIWNMSLDVAQFYKKYGEVINE